jgi:hypothetical protein
MDRAVIEASLYANAVSLRGSREEAAVIMKGHVLEECGYPIDKGTNLKNRKECGKTSSTRTHHEKMPESMNLSK